MPTGADIHIDAPLSNLAVEAFNSNQDFVAQQLFPVVPVSKESDNYYTISKEAWLRVPDTERARKTSAKQIDFDVSSEQYFAKNHALRNDNALEDLANADQAVRLRENSVKVVMQGLLRGLEDRVASTVTSVSNVGSGVVLTGGDKWSDFANSDPISDVTTGHAFIRQTTGLVANTALIDHDTLSIIRRHPVLLDLFKYTKGNFLSLDELKSVFDVENIIVGKAVKNTAKRGQSASMANIWGNNFLLARVEQGTSMQTATFGLGFRWTPAGFPAPMTVERYRDGDPSKKIEWVETGYYQDEKIVAKDLAYLINGTL